MGIKWQVFLERGVFNDIKRVVSKKFLGVGPQTPTLLPSIAVQPPPHVKSAPQSLKLETFYSDDHNPSVFFLSII